MLAKLLMSKWLSAKSREIKKAFYQIKNGFLMDIDPCLCSLSLGKNTASKEICNPFVSSVEGEKKTLKIENGSNKESHVPSTILLWLVGVVNIWHLISAINLSQPDKESHKNEKLEIIKPFNLNLRIWAGSLLRRENITWLCKHTTFSPIWLERPS